MHVLCFTFSTEKKTQVPMRAYPSTVRIDQGGKINSSPTGEPISVIFGTNRDELALFLIAIPFVIPHVKLPFNDNDMTLVASHLTSYHSNWGDVEVKLSMHIHVRITRPVICKSYVLVQIFVSCVEHEMLQEHWRRTTSVFTCIPLSSKVIPTMIRVVCCARWMMSCFVVCITVVNSRTCFKILRVLHSVQRT